MLKLFVIAAAFVAGLHAADASFIYQRTALGVVVMGPVVSIDDDITVTVHFTVGEHHATGTQTVGFPAANTLISPQGNIGLLMSLWTAGQSPNVAIDSIAITIAHDGVSSTKLVAKPSEQVQY